MKFLEEQGELGLREWWLVRNYMKEFERAKAGKKEYEFSTKIPYI